MNIFSFIVFYLEIPISKQCCTVHKPHSAASELGLHYLFIRRMFKFIPFSMISLLLAHLSTKCLW